MQVDGVGAIVTGGASGLGAATARALAAKGAKVTIFDLNADKGEALAAEIGGRFASVNVADEPAVSAAMDAAAEAHGVARILVNCAGIGTVGKAVGRDHVPHDMDLFRRTIDVNLTGTFIMISRFAARLQQAEPIGEERGVVVSTASVAAYDGQIGQPAYAATKGGIVAMTLPLAREFARDLIRVMGVAPGIFLTPLLEGLPEAAQESLGKMVPHPARLGDPKEFAQLVTAIVENPMLNGEVIRIDGAIRMAPK